MKPICILAALLALLTGCATIPDTTPAGEPVDSRQTLAEYTAADLRSALALAEQAGDAAAVQCYSGLLPLVEGAPAEPDQAEVAPGAFSAFQRLRNRVRSGPDTQTIEDVNLACAALWMSAKGDAARVAVGLRGLLR